MVFSGPASRIGPGRGGCWTRRRRSGPRAAVQAQLAHGSAPARRHESCGPERERNPTRRTESASCFSSLRFRSPTPRRLPWPRPCPPPPSVRRRPLPRPPHAALGPEPRRCASGIAPSRPSPPPAAPRRRGSSTTVGTPTAASPEQDCVSLPAPIPLWRLALPTLLCDLPDAEEAASSGRRRVLVAGAAAFLSRPNPAACELLLRIYFTIALDCFAFCSVACFD